MITKFAPKRNVKTKNGKEYVKSAKIQRLITPDRLRRKRLLKAIQKQRREKADKDQKEYQELVKKEFKKKPAASASKDQKKAKGK